MPVTVPMSEWVGRFVRSTAGHDKESILLVVGEEGEFLFLADGKSRSILRPKRKKLRHTEPLGEATFLTAEKLRRKEPVSDRELKRAIAAFKGEISLGKR